MAATTQMKYNYGTTPTVTNAETGIKFNREDTQTGTTPIPIPTTTGTNYSWHKALHLGVDTSASTTISNRKVKVASTPTTGLKIWWTLFASDTYNQADASDIADNASTNDAAPPTGAYGQAWAEVTTTYATWDATSVSAGSTGKNGKYIVLCLGVSNNYTGGAGSAISLPNLSFQYDEA